MAKAKAIINGQTVTVNIVSATPRRLDLNRNTSQSQRAVLNGRGKRKVMLSKALVDKINGRK